MTLAPCTSSPIASAFASRSSTSGAATAVSAISSVPTVGAAPSAPPFVLPTFAVCVPPSTRVPASVSAGSGVSGTKRATPFTSAFASPARRPGCASPSGTMNTLVSTPAGRPDCARPVLASAFALSRNCRSVPAPASRVLTIVSKLKPKSTPVTSAEPSVTLATDCGVAAGLVSVPSAAAVVFESASAIAGFSPPTRSVTATGVPLEASVRHVCTDSSPATAPGRDERTLAFTTRTVYAPAGQPSNTYAPAASVRASCRNAPVPPSYNSTRAPGRATPEDAASERPAPPP